MNILRNPNSKPSLYDEIDKIVAENKVLKECIKTLTAEFAVKMQEAESENKALKEQNTILQNQNKDLLVSLESLNKE